MNKIKSKINFLRWISMILSVSFLVFIPIFIGVEHSIVGQYDNYERAYSKDEFEKLKRKETPNIVYIKDAQNNSQRKVDIKANNHGIQKVTETYRIDHIDRNNSEISYILGNTFTGTPEDRYNSIKEMVRFFSFTILTIVIIIIPVTYLTISKYIRDLDKMENSACHK